MTPAERIAYLRNMPCGSVPRDAEHAILAVCDLAERALLTDDALRGLLAKHRDLYYGDTAIIKYAALYEDLADLLPDVSVVRAWAAHAGIGGTE